MWSFRQAAMTARDRPGSRVRAAAADPGAASAPRRSRSRLNRPAVLIVLGGLLSGLVVTLTPGVASAGAIVTCPAGITEWKLIAGVAPGTAPSAAPDGFPGIWSNVWEGYRYTLVSATPQFLVSDGRALDNGTDSPVNFTITSSISKTYRISATVGISANNVKGFLTANVSSSIESSVTTSIGVTLSTTVPPRTRLIAEYGTDVYQVSYYIEAWRWRGPPLYRRRAARRGCRRL
jgi:hypothetical protein